jgi:hypothetical protein
MLIDFGDIKQSSEAVDFRKVGFGISISQSVRWSLGCWTV